jgi:hypothetical protein
MVSPLWNTVFWLFIGVFGLVNFFTALLGTNSGRIFGMAASPTAVLAWNALLAISCFYFAYRSFPDRESFRSE